MSKRNWMFGSQKYLEPWKRDYYRRFDDPRIQLAAHGLLAANAHNMQPWRIKLDQADSMVFYLYADPTRLSVEVDPVYRQFMVTQGTFLENVEIAGDEIGFRSAIELFPEGEFDEHNLTESMKTKPVAKIKLTKVEPHQNQLYDLLFLHATDRTAYQTGNLSENQISQLEAIANGSNLTVKVFHDRQDLGKLSDYAMKAAVIEGGVKRVMKETEDIFRANEYQKNQYRFGFSVESQGTSGVMAHIMQDLVTLMPSLNKGKAASDRFVQSARMSVQNTPAYAMIISKENSPMSQVKSGMLYSRFVLEAHRMGLVVQPMSQALEEYPEMEEIYHGIHREYAPDGGTIQMFVRLGKPTKEAPPSMRRSVMDLIIE